MFNLILLVHKHVQWQLLGCAAFPDMLVCVFEVIMCSRCYKVSIRKTRNAH